MPVEDPLGILDNKEEDKKKKKSSNDPLGILKKKEPTESPSEPDRSPSSLDTKDQVQNQNQEGDGSQDLGFSGIEGKVKVYMGYPGKEKNQYKHVNGVWYKRIPVEKKVTGSSMSSAIMLHQAKKSKKNKKYTDWKPIKNEGSINALNRVFKSKDAKSYSDTPSGLPDEILEGGYRHMGPKKVFDPEIGAVVRTTHTGIGESPLVPLVDYTGKKLQREDNIETLKEARDYELEWHKLRGTSQDQINKIKKEYDDKIGDEERNLDVIKRNEAWNNNAVWESIANYEKSPDEAKIDKSIPNDLSTMSDSEIEKTINEDLKDFGFSASMTDGILYVDNARGIPHDGFDIRDGDRSEIIKLRDYLTKYRTTKDFRDKLEATTSKTFGGSAYQDDWMDFMIKDYAKNTDLYPISYREDIAGMISKRSHEISLQKKDLDLDIESLKEKFRNLEEDIRTSGGMTKEHTDRYNELVKESESISKREEEIRSLYDAITQDEDLIDAHIASMMMKKAAEDEKVGSTLGGIWNSFLSGIESYSETGVSLSANILPNLLPNAGMAPSEYEKLKNKGLSHSEIVDVSKKQLLETVNTDGAIVELFGSETTDAYLKSEDRSMFENAVFGLAETVPVLIGGGVKSAGTVGLTKFATKVTPAMSLASLSYAHIESEMRDNPEFADISESEKKLISVPYAIAMGVLENLGFSKLLHSNPVAKKFTDSVIYRVLNNSPRGASMDYIQKSIKEEIEREIQKGTFKIVEGFLVEGETGALQEIGDIGIKETYNAIKGKEMFETPDNFSEGVGQVLQGSFMEAIGGGIMTTMMRAPSIMRNGMARSNVDSKSFDVLMSIKSDPKFKSDLVAKVKLSILNNEMTEAEGNDILESYDNMMAVMDKVPEGIKDPKKAFDLVQEKQALEAEIKGKDAAAVSKERARVSEINSELEAMSIGVETETKTEETTETEDAPETKVATEIEAKETVETKDAPVVETDTDVEATKEKKEKRIYPLADKNEWYGDSNYEETGGEMKEMSPDEFLERSKPLEIDDASRENIEDLKQMMLEGKGLDPLTIYSDDVSDTRSTDGRHRAIAAKELGIESIPVIDFTSKKKPEVTTETESEAETVEETEEDVDLKPFESAFTKGAKSTEDFLKGIEDKLDQFGKENLGMNVPTVIAKKAIQAARVAASSAKNVSEIIDAAITEVRNSDWYKNKLSKQEQKQAEIATQRLFTDPVTPKKSKTKIQKKVDETTGVTKKPKKVVVSERTALRDQITMAARNARKGAEQEKEARREIGTVVKDILGRNKGKVKADKVRSIVSRAMNMNLSNPVMADRFISYVENVAKDATYESKVSKSFEKRKEIGRIKKRKGIQSEVSNLISDFMSIDPRSVENIDEYLEMAEALSAFSKPTSTRKGKLSLKDFSDMAPMSEYISKQRERQEKIDKDTMEIHFPELFEQGILNRDMSVSDMKSIIRSIDGEGGAQLSNEKDIKDRLDKVIDSYVAAGSSMIKNGIDPISGEKIELTDKEKSAIRRIKAVDTSKLSTKDMMELVDATGNLISNRFTGNIDNILETIKGAENASNFFKKYGKAKKMSGFLRGYDYHFASLPILIDTVMTGAGRGNAFMTESGLNELIRGSSQAQLIAEMDSRRYESKFKKTKPNGDKFNSAKNTYERGMIAFLMRNIPGTEAEMKSEFDRRVRIISETIEYLRSDKSSSKEKKKGDVYAEIFDKLDLENANYDTFLNNADKTNIEAVQWWIDNWSKNYQELRDVSVSVYNKDLPRDLNYTPDRYKMRDSAEPKSVDEEINDGAFGKFNDSAHNTESSALMKANKPRVLPKNRVIDLDFDSNNHSMSEAALIDLRTAKSIRKLNGFIESSSFSDMFSDSRDAKVVRKRITDYVRRVKKKDFIREEQTKLFRKLTNSLAKAGTARVLGGIDQIPKQTVSVMLNTMINSNGRLGLVEAMSSDFSKWIESSGMPIARRGIGAETAIENTEKKLDKAAEGFDKAMKGIDYLGDKYLKWFLSDPDKFVARASFLAFYKKSLKSQGKSTDIVYSKPMDETAANYAQHMVDRQQFVSDSDLAGAFFTDQSTWADFARKTLFPFANFVMNQKSRMYGDVRTVTSKNTTLEDRGAALKSLAGLGVEMVTFHAMSILLRHGYKELARFITGHEPDGEEKRFDDLVKKENNERLLQGKEEMTDKEEAAFRLEKYREYESGKNWKTFWTSLVKDVASPVPVLDQATVKVFNEGFAVAGDKMNRNSEEADREVEAENATRKTPMSKREEKEFRDKIVERETFQLWDFDNDNSYGVLSIGSDKWSEYSKSSEAADEGIIRIEYNGRETKKYLTPEDQEIAKMNRWAMLMYVNGIVPSDVGKEAYYIQKNLEKSALTETQMQKYEYIKKEKGSVSKEDMKLVKSKKTLKTIEKEIKKKKSGSGSGVVESVVID